IGAAVDTPAFPDALLRRRVHQLHAALDAPGEELEAESRLALVCERLRQRLRPESADAAGPAGSGRPPSRTAAHLLRDLVDARAGSPPAEPPAAPLRTPCRRSSSICSRLRPFVSGMTNLASSSRTRLTPAKTHIDPPMPRWSFADMVGNTAVTMPVAAHSTVV